MPGEMTIAMVRGAVQDSVVVDSPLPGGAAAFFRFLFEVPQWIQILGAVVVVVVAGFVARRLWRRRHELLKWVTGQPRKVKIALVVGAAVSVLVAATAGGMSWNYMQRDNDFCTGCHVMEGPYSRLGTSEHAALSCHDCHQQSIFASSRQLVLWVIERPEDIRAHAPVPNAICENCHMTGEPEVWQRVAETAGHRTHLESDSMDLAEVMCVTCHGLEVHSFAPVDSTCGQAGCHIGTDIVLGEMGEQTALHCATCHVFAAEVPLLATRDSAAGALRPGESECLSCHAMRAVLEEFDADNDPHSGTCGMCHNPHEQERSSEALTTCATSGCHDNWRARPFHVGTQHVNVGDNCTLCHAPHSARVDPSDCQGCHASIAGRDDVPESLRQRLRRVAPFDTSAALQRIGSAAPWWSHERGADSNGTRAGPTTVTLTPESSRPIELFTLLVFAAPQDTFSHQRHDTLSCLTCHTTQEGHGGLTFEQPRGCDICHHQAPQTSDCRACHAVATLDGSLVASVTVHVEQVTRTNEVGFEHNAHVSVPCANCHVEPVTLGATTAVATCTDCHDDHHAQSRTCAGCHVVGSTDIAHAPPVDAHVACDACHDQATIATLVPDRPFCLTCHESEATHYSEEECTVCHMAADPRDFRPHLTRAVGRRP